MWSILILFILDVFNEYFKNFGWLAYKSIVFIKKTLLNNITPKFDQIKKTANLNRYIILFRLNTHFFALKVEIKTHYDLDMYWVIG